MSKSWFPHGSKPNVPQPPYSLNNEPRGPRMQRSNSFQEQPIRQDSLLPYNAPQASQAPQTQRLPRGAPPVPPVPAQHANPHQAHYHAQLQAPVASTSTASAPMTRTSNRQMTPEQRQAYIREVDARNASAAAARAASPTPASPTQPSGLRPLQLPSRRTSAVTPEPMANLPTPPENSDDLHAYLAEHFNDPAPANAPPSPAASQSAEPVNDGSPTVSQPSSPTPVPAPAPAATYAQTASLADGSHRIPPTRIYSIGGTARAPAGVGAPAQPADPNGPTIVASAAPNVTPAPSDGQAATIEVYSNGAVFARIILPYPPQAAQSPRP